MLVMVSENIFKSILVLCFFVVDKLHITKKENSFSKFKNKYNV
jgi:hypothetical protein